MSRPSDHISDALSNPIFILKTQVKINADDFFDQTVLHVLALRDPAQCFFISLCFSLLFVQFLFAPSFQPFLRTTGLERQYVVLLGPVLPEFL